MCFFIIKCGTNWQDVGECFDMYVLFEFSSMYMYHYKTREVKLNVIFVELQAVFVDLLHLIVKNILIDDSSSYQQLDFIVTCKFCVWMCACLLEYNSNLYVFLNSLDVIIF